MINSMFDKIEIPALDAIAQSEIAKRIETRNSLIVEALVSLLLERQSIDAVALRLEKEAQMLREWG